MVRKLLATTAIASILATGAFAQTATAPATGTEPAATSAPMGTTATTGASTAATTQTAGGAQIAYVQNLGTNQYLESDLDGATVYASNAADAETAGEIQNFVVGADGAVLAVVIDTGRFLGDQSKVVAVPFDKVEWASVNNEQRAVLTATREELTAAPAFTGGEQQAAATTTPAGSTGSMAPSGGAAMAPATGGAATTAPGMAAGTTTSGTAAGGMAAGNAMTPATGQMATAGTASQDGYLAMLEMDQHLSNDIVGDNVYSGPAEDAEQIGSINDLVIASSGRVEAFVVGVGGFLGIGQKDVGVPFDNISMTTGADGQPHAALAATREQLTDAPSFESGDDRMAAGTTAATTTTTTAAGTAAGGMAAGTTGMAAGTGGTAGTMATDTTDATASTTGAQGIQTGTPVTGADLSADNLMGTRVYGPDNQTIGSVGDIALTAEGQVDAVIVDVGGFLGIGAKPVAVAMDNLNIMRDSGGSLTLTTQFTQDQLRSAPDYNRDTYAQNRDEMRITSPGDLPPAGSNANQ